MRTSRPSFCNSHTCKVRRYAMAWACSSNRRQKLSSSGVVCGLIRRKLLLTCARRGNESHVTRSQNPVLARPATTHVDTAVAALFLRANLVVGRSQSRFDGIHAASIVGAAG